MSPFRPEKAAIQAGRLMLAKIDELIENSQDFAFETTLATRSYKNFILKARNKGYKVTLLFFWLQSSDLAVQRVETRVNEGGHNIPVETIRRRYDNGLKNFFMIFKQIVDEWLFIDNSGDPYQIVAEGNSISDTILNKDKWLDLKIKYGK